MCTVRTAFGRPLTLTPLSSGSGAGVDLRRLSPLRRSLLLHINTIWLIDNAHSDQRVNKKSTSMIEHLVAHTIQTSSTAPA